MSPKPNWTVGDFTADSVDTERETISGEVAQFPIDATVVAIGEGAGVDPDDYVDPANTTTPIADAMAATGTDTPVEIHVPTGTIQEETTFSPEQKVKIVGKGSQHSTIEFTDTSVDGIEADGAAFLYLENVQISGSSASTRSGGTTSALHVINSNVRALRMYDVEFAEWANKVWWQDSGSFFLTDIGRVRFQACQGTPVVWDTLGHSTDIKQLIILNPSSNETTLFDITGGGNVSINSLYIATGGAGSGHSDKVWDISGTSNTLINVQDAYIEGSDTASTDEWSRLLNIGAACQLGFGKLRFNDISMDWGVLYANNPNHSSIPFIHQTNTTVNNTLIAFDDSAQSADSLIEYGGPVSEMNDRGNNAGQNFYSRADDRFVDPAASGTVSVSSGGTAVAHSVAAGTEFDLEWGIDADPNAAVQIRQRLDYDDTDEQQDIVFEELSANGGVDVAFYVEEH